MSGRKPETGSGLCRRNPTRFATLPLEGRRARRHPRIRGSDWRAAGVAGVAAVLAIEAPSRGSIWRQYAVKPLQRDVVLGWSLSSCTARTRHLPGLYIILTLYLVDEDVLRYDFANCQGIGCHRPP